METIKNLALAVETASETPDWMVVVMGVGVVFFGLVLIILICKIMGLFFAKTKKQESKSQAVAATPVAETATIENRQEIIAAVSAVVAEELGTDVSAIRILSFKKI